jgi:glyoxylase-like metal-dependent hydrolase (beta-lactamase superfamily II)
MNPLKLRIMELPPIGTNAYLLIHEERGEAILIDAPFGAKREVDLQMQRFGTTLKGVWLTHGHWDHMLDAHQFNEAGIPVYGHVEDEVLVNQPLVMASYAIPGIEYLPARLDGHLRDGQELELLGEPVRVLHTPGHSPGSVSFHFSRLGWVFCGDVVFSGSVGRTDFPGCSHERLMQSIREQFLTLSDEHVLFPGHGPRTTVGRERELNPFLRT